MKERGLARENATLDWKEHNMDVVAPRGLLRAFSELKDPRVNRTKKHSLLDILTIAICAVICGADG